MEKSVTLLRSIREVRSQSKLNLPKIWRDIETDVENQTHQSRDLHANQRRGRKT